MSTRYRRLRPLAERDVERAANIIGESSAAHKALQLLKQQRDSGHNVKLFTDGSAIIVGPYQGCTCMGTNMCDWCRS